MDRHFSSPSRLTGWEEEEGQRGTLDYPVPPLLAASQKGPIPGDAVLSPAP